MLIFHRQNVSKRKDSFDSLLENIVDVSEKYKFSAYKMYIQS